MSTQEHGSHDQSFESDTEAALVNLLRQEIGDDRFEMWFSHSRCLRHDASKQLVTVQSDNEFSLRRIQQSFQREVRQAVDRVCGPTAKLLFLVVPDAHEVQTERSDSSTLNVQQNLAFSAPTQEPSNVRFPKRSVPTLKSFSFAPQASLLQGAVAQVIQTPGQISPVLVYGPTGSGKTHLLEAITHQYRRQLRLKKCLYVSADQFTTQFVASLRQGTGLPMFRRKFHGLDLLAIDDIQFFAGKKATLVEFQQTIDHLQRLGKQILLASDRSPFELGELGAEICTRIESGLHCSTQYPDFDGRLKIAMGMCQTRNIRLAKPVLELIAEKLPRDMRRLSGAINRLHAYATTFGDTISESFARKALEDLFSQSGPSCTTMVSIEKAVCDFCQVKPQELKSGSRQKRISTARMLAMYLSREYTGAAFSEIGEYFGGRSHSTVIAAQKKVKHWLVDNKGISLPHAKFTTKEAIERLESDLRIG